MRSEIIFRAEEKVINKFQLCQTVSKVTRQLHINSDDTKDTINVAFANIAAGGLIPRPIHLCIPTSIPFTTLLAS